MPSARNQTWARRTYLASGIAFAGTLGALGLQMKAGADPAVGAVAVPPPRPHLIITKKIIRTTIVTKRIVQPAPIPAVIAVSQPSGLAGTPAVQQSAPVVQPAAPVVQQSAPVVRQSAPVVRQSAPVRAAAPAAPTTRAS